MLSAPCAWPRVSVKCVGEQIGLSSVSGKTFLMSAMRPQKAAAANELLYLCWLSTRLNLLKMRAARWKKYWISKRIKIRFPIQMDLLLQLDGGGGIYNRGPRRKSWWTSSGDFAPNSSRHLCETALKMSLHNEWKMEIKTLSTFYVKGGRPRSINHQMNFYEFLMLPRRRRTSESQSNLNSPHNEQTTFLMALRPNQNYINTSLTFLVLASRQKFICFRSSKRYAKGESLQMASDL